MEEERQDDHSADTNPSDNDQANPNNTNRPAPWLVLGFIAVAVLIIAGLFLPPISLGERLGLGGGGDTADGGTTPTTDTSASAPDGFSTGSGVAASKVSPCPCGHCYQ